jgi:hypothetical protein
MLEQNTNSCDSDPIDDPCCVAKIEKYFLVRKTFFLQRKPRLHNYKRQRCLRTEHVPCQSKKNQEEIILKIMFLPNQ